LPITELKRFVSVFKSRVNPFVASLHLYHENVNGPVPPGLTAFRLPFTVPDELQKIKTGFFTPGEEGYEVYLTAFATGAVSWPMSVTGNNKAEMRKAKRTGNLFFIRSCHSMTQFEIITLSQFVWYNQMQV
jgi:hypothetical protein